MQFRVTGLRQPSDLHNTAGSKIRKSSTNSHKIVRGDSDERALLPFEGITAILPRPVRLVAG